MCPPAERRESDGRGQREEGRGGKREEKTDPSAMERKTSKKTGPVTRRHTAIIRHTTIVVIKPIVQRAWGVARATD